MGIIQWLHSMAQGGNDVTSYYPKRKVLWDELKDFIQSVSCSCEGMKMWLEHQQRDFVLQFLMGLNESYVAIRAQILMMNPLPLMNKAFSLVVQEEKQRGISSQFFIPGQSIASLNGRTTNTGNSGMKFGYLVIHMSSEGHAGPFFRHY